MRLGEGDTAGVPVEAARPHLARRQADAGDDHRAPPVHGEQRQPFPHARLIPGNGGIGAAEQNGGLGEVGGDHIGFFRQSLHAGAQLGGVAAVGCSVVPHHRVHQHQRARAAEAGDKVPNHADLSGGAQKTAVNGVEGGTQLPPVGHAVLHLFRQVQKDRPVRVGKAGVGREIGGEHGLAPAAHGGQDGQNDGSGAAAEAGQVVDGGHLGGASHMGIPPSGSIRKQPETEKPARTIIAAGRQSFN